MYTEVEILNKSFTNQAADQKLTSNSIVRLRPQEASLPQKRLQKGKQLATIYTMCRFATDMVGRKS